MSDALRPRRRTGGAAIARHGRLPRRGAVTTLLKLLATLVGVVVVSAVTVGAVALWDIGSSLKPTVTLAGPSGEAAPPSVGALDGAFNVLLAGSDSGGGNPIYGERGENLNDVTMLLHVSADHEHATVVSFPRDMFVPIPSCPDPDGGNYPAMSRQKINNTLTYGGLPCTVLTVEELTGLDIRYAAMIEFDGVVAMSNAVGGVPVCVAGRIDDPKTNLHLSAGEHTLQGQQALGFLRTRHGVGDGSDLGRISNQQVFLSSLMRTIKSAGTLGNPGKLYGLAKAATSNMTLSDSLAGIPTMVSMAMALKDVSLDDIVFVEYPNHYVDGGGGVEPTVGAADQLMDAIANDRPIRLSGTTGVGSELAPGVTPSPTPDAQGGTPTPGSGVELPDSVHGQTAAEQTCSRPYFG